MRFMPLCALLCALVPPHLALSQPAPTDFALRTEVVAFPSQTLTDADVLTGKNKGAPVTLGGILRIARGAERPPLVILMHGSGGLGSGLESWERHLNKSGISTFSIDSFTGRGLTSTVFDQSQLDRLNGIVDVFNAMTALKNHPRVDSNKIALMGFSRGGQYVLQASQSRLNRIWNSSGIVPAAYITLYAACGTRYKDETDRVAKPIRMFHGTVDDYVLPKPCRELAGRLKGAGLDVTFIDVPDAHHAFDTPYAALNATPNPRIQTTNCPLLEGEQGILINTETNQPFSYKDSCVKRGATVSFSPAATKFTQEAVREYLVGLFSLK